MKFSQFTFCLGLVLFLAMVSTPASATPFNKAQDYPTLAPGFYMVVAAYHVNAASGADQYTKSLKGSGHQAGYGYSPRHKKLMVYIASYDDFSIAVKDLQRVRNEPSFKDAWVHVLRDEHYPEGMVPSKKSEKKQVLVKDEVKETEVVEEEEIVEEVVEVVEEEDAVEEEPAEDPNALKTKEGYRVYFNVYHARDYYELEGMVHLIDGDKARKIDEFEANNHVRISDPENKTGKLTLICEIPGFRKIQYDFNFNDLPDNLDDEGIEVIDDAVVINFEMVMFQKGDIFTLYNVFFYQDAVIMRPESQYELDQLVSRLKENTRLQIRLHGHTNGNAKGKIIRRSASDGDMFSMDARNTDSGFGSAKKLSKERAEIIRDYLVANGVESGRMKVKAWGGNRMLYDKESSQAPKNVRVEVEILED